MEMQIRSYSAWLPANVRYDNDLPANAKILFAELSCLSNVYGYAFATNKYFADLYDLSEDRVSKLIHLLEKKGYIRIETERNECNFVVRRKIYIAQFAPAEVKNTDDKSYFYPAPELKITTPSGKNDGSNNNTINNKTNNNNTSSEPSQQKLIEDQQKTIESLTKALEDTKVLVSKLEKDSAKASSKKSAKSTSKKSVSAEEIEQYWSKYSPDTRRQFEEIYNLMLSKNKELDPNYIRPKLFHDQCVLKLFKYALSNNRDVSEVRKTVIYGLNDSFWAPLTMKTDSFLKNFEKLLVKANMPANAKRYGKQSLVGSEFDRQHQNTVFDHNDEGRW